MKRLALVMLLILLCVMIVNAQEPDFDHWVFAPVVHKACTPTPTPAPTPTYRPPPTPIPTCDCSGDIYNCSDFTWQWQAQVCFDYCMQEVGYDIHKLDRDNDGMACEGLPQPPPPHM